MRGSFGDLPGTPVDHRVPSLRHGHPTWEGTERWDTFTLEELKLHPQVLGLSHNGNGYRESRQFKQKSECL